MLKLSQSQAKNPMHFKETIRFNNKLKKNMQKEALNYRRSAVIANQKQFINSATGIEATKLAVDFIKLGNEELSSKPEKVKEQFQNYYQRLFSHSNNSDYSTLLDQHPDWAPYFQTIPGSEEIMSNITDPFTMTELQDIINLSKLKSAPGPDEITYEHFKLIKSPIILGHILKMLNYSLSQSIWPTDNNQGNIILLLKKDIYSGSPKDLRPITLLQTIRKIFTGLITRRLTDTIYSNNLLRGNNYGFVLGKSTNNPITIVRHIIYHAKLKNKKFYSLLLDIEKAYDTVPLSALILGLKRIGASDHLINIIKMLQNDRQIQVLTAYGPTDIITPERGLPQGDKISPILWNIFYDALLVRLDETFGYKFSEELSISKLTYADDLQTFTESPLEIQIQANIVSSYLNIFGMQANGGKTILWTNHPVSDLDYIREFTPTVNNELVTAIHCSTDLTRILGAFFTSDGLSTQTIAHAFNQINNLLQVISFKFTPGFLSVYLINTVLIPILAYRLQVTPIPQKAIKSLNTSFRKLVRKSITLAMLPILFSMIRS